VDTLVLKIDSDKCVFSKSFLLAMRDTAESALYDWLKDNAPDYVLQTFNDLLVLYLEDGKDPAQVFNLIEAVSALSYSIPRLGGHFISPVGEVMNEEQSSVLTNLEHNSQQVTGDIYTRLSGDGV
jgi:hypothetical protein